MKRISLISNSSIQYYKFNSTNNLNFGTSNKTYFHQPFDGNILDFTLDTLFTVSSDGIKISYRKQELLGLDFSVNNKLNSSTDPSLRIGAANKKEFKVL